MFDFFPPSLHSLILPSPPPPTPADLSPVRGGIHSRSCCLSFSTGLSAVASIHLPPPCLLLSYSHSWRFDSAFFFFSRAVFFKCEIHFFMLSVSIVVVTCVSIQSLANIQPHYTRMAHVWCPLNHIRFASLFRLMQHLHIVLMMSITARYHSSRYRFNEHLRNALWRQCRIANCR